MMNFSIQDYVSRDTPIIMAKKKDFLVASSFVWEEDLYYKQFSFNELLGAKLAHLQGSRTAEYFLTRIIDEDNLRLFDDILIGSYDFKSPDCQYCSLLDYPLVHSGDPLRNLLYFCASDDNQTEFMDEVLSMFALDTYMQQKDRGYQNVLLEMDPKRGLHLSPIYDYTMSFRNWDWPKELYKNVLHPFSYYDDYWEYMERYPEFREKLQFYQELNLQDVIQDICMEHKLNFSASIYEQYKRQEEESQKQLSKILS